MADIRPQRARARPLIHGVVDGSFDVPAAMMCARLLVCCALGFRRGYRAGQRRAIASPSDAPP